MAKDDNMSEEVIKNGRKWFASRECIEQIKEKIQRSGIPLELISNNILTKKGYRCSRYFYSNPLSSLEADVRKFREIDVYAYKTLSSFKIGRCDVHFDIRIFCECKHREDGTYIAFEKESKYLPTLPTTLSGRKMTYGYYKQFSFPMIIRKISEFNLKNMKPDGDATIHGASNQLMNACNYNYSRYRNMAVRHLYENLKRELGKGYPDNTKENIMEEYSDMDVINRLPLFSFVLAFCVIVVNHEAGLMKAIYNYKEGKVTDIEDVGYGIYPFVSQDADRYENILNNFFEYPILVADVDYLDKCVDSIEDGVSKMATTIEGIIRKQPHNLKGLILDEVFGTD